MRDCDYVAKQVGVSPRTVQRWARERRIPHIRIGRLVRFTDAQIKEIADTYTIHPDNTYPIHQPNPVYTPNQTIVVPIRRKA